jgi:membrane-bound lytic murein transglycosylase D
MKWLPLLFFFAWISSIPNIYAASLEPAHFPSLVSSLRIDTPLEFCGETVPIESQEIRERFEKELLLSLWDRTQVILWLKRSSRYIPHIEQLLQENEMPDDLKYIAIAESALRPHAGSRKGAIGFWQFTTATGLKYGLVINEYCDERRNLFASTAAAIRYFKALYQIFKSWTLAAAAYNMGEEGLLSEILEQDTTHYYQLYLPLETQRYIFRTLSVKLILSNPEKYGFNLMKNDYYPPLSFDRIQVDCVEEIPLRIIARAGKTHFKAIKDLNPEIRGHYLAKGKHTILIPHGGSADFQARYHSLVDKFLKARKEKVYIVKKGDNLSLIAERFGVPLAALIIWNRIDIKRPIHPGDRLIIYGKEVKLNEPGTDEEKGKSGLN